MKATALLSSLSMVGVALYASAANIATDCGWRPLFADDLSDATCDSEVWSRDADGCLTATKDVAIWTRDDWSCFELSCEYNLEPDANSGILIYCSDTKKWIPNAVEIQLIDDDAPKWKNLNPRQANLAFFGHQAPMANPARPAGEWNSITVRADGTKISIARSGDPANGCDLTTELAATGKIGLLANSPAMSAPEAAQPNTACRISLSDLASLAPQVDAIGNSRKANVLPKHAATSENLEMT